MQASVHLDAIRGLAAVAVLLTHWRNLLFVDYGSLTRSEKLLTLPLYLFTQGGHLAVMIFFVLSGYLISGSVLRSARKGTFTLLDYGSHRLVRLWTVLIPSLIVGGVLDRIGMHHGGTAALYHGLVGNHTSIDAFPTLNPLGALRNLVFLQTIRGGGAFGSNAPLWSVAFEFWYYALFPAAFVVTMAGSGLLRRSLCALAVIAIALLVGPQVLGMFPFWLGGALLHALPRLRLGRGQRVLAALAYLGTFVGLSVAYRAVHSDSLFYAVDALMTVATVLFLWVLLSSTAVAGETLYRRASRRLSGFSYTLYTIHFPALMVFTAFALGSARWHPTALHLVFGGAALAFVLLLTLGMHSLFESRTPAVQRAADQLTAPRLVVEGSPLLRRTA